MDEHLENLVLDDNVTHQDFTKVVSTDLGLEQFETFLPTEEWKVFGECWRTPDGLTSVCFLDKKDLDFRYIWISGSQAQKFFSRLYELLPSSDGEDLIESLEDATDSLQTTRAVVKIGSAYPEYDPQAFEIFDRCLKHEFAPFRGAALNAIAFYLWPECRPLIEQEVETESEEQIRKYAVKILEEYQKRAVAGS